jgi:hypothetical protein
MEVIDMKKEIFVKISLVLLTFYVGLFLILGCTTKSIYVNMLNLTGPWDGTETHPYKTIQDGINAAKSGERVLVMDNAYFENITLKEGVDLEPWKGTPKIAGSSGSPTILAKGDNAIVGFVIRGGDAGIKVELGGILSSKDKIPVLIQDCEIYETHRAIEVTTSKNLAFAKNQRKSVYLAIDHNWIRNLTGDGIRVGLNGPKTGELQISVRIEENIIQGPFFAAVQLEAIGQGPNPGGFVRALFTGIVGSNLLFGGKNGIRLHGKNLGSAGVTVFNNTIANNIAHGITASADPGPDGTGSAHPDVINNIISGNQGYGYQEFTSFTSAVEMNNNLFFQNTKGHYADDETGNIIKTQAGLNQPIVNNKVVFYSGSGNLVGNPQFATGAFPWMGKTNKDGPHVFFLKQTGTQKSPAIDKGKGSAKDARLSARTTRTDFSFDTGIVDIGFHYKKL